VVLPLSRAATIRSTFRIHCIVIVASCWLPHPVVRFIGSIGTVIAASVNPAQIGIASEIVLRRRRRAKGSALCRAAHESFLACTPSGGAQKSVPTGFDAFYGL
jgi:hypothetical protein